MDIARTVNGFVALVDEIVTRHPEVRHRLDRPEYDRLRRYKALSDIVEITNTRDEPVNAASDFFAKPSRRGFALATTMPIDS